MIASNPAWIEACAKAIASVAYLPICEAVRAANRANSLTTPLPDPITEQHQVLAAWADQQATAALSVLAPLIEADAKERCARLVERMAGEVRGTGTWVLDRDPSAEDIALAIRNAFPAKGE